MSFSHLSPRCTSRFSFVAAAVAIAACGPATSTDSSGGSGGAAPGVGGVVGSGGSIGSGGVVGSGGVTGTGGVVGVGGVTGSGGASTGGSVGTGGSSTGGASGTGGAATGGTGSGGAGTGGGGGGDIPIPTEANSIAYTGCSMAWNIGNGYKRVGGTVMWNSDNYQTSAMVVQNWTSASSQSWQLFDQKMNANGGIDAVKAIMVQICITSNRPTDADLRNMVNAAREHVNPGTPIYIVGQPVYLPEGHECSIAGTGGADWTDEKAQELAADDTINENMYYLGQFVLDRDAGEVQASPGDTCHATNPVGEDSLGEQAKAYFGG